MSLSLKDQLIAAGLVKKEEPKKEQAKSTVVKSEHNKEVNKHVGQARPNSAPRHGPGNQGKPEVSKPGHNQHNQHGQRPPHKNHQQTNKPAHQAAPAASPQARSAESDLAQAWKARASQEQAEREAEKRAAEEKAKLKQERKRKVQSLLQGKALTQEGADVVRHFQYGKKITRIYLTAEQVTALANHEIGIAQYNGRFAPYAAEVMRELLAIEPVLVAVFAEVGSSSAQAPDVDPAYSDDKYQVPDDLRW